MRHIRQLESNGKDVKLRNRLEHLGNRSDLKVLHMVESLIRYLRYQLQSY